MSKMKGKLFVISGPSGVGKDSVIEEAKRLGLRCGQVITTTSRKPRGEEKEGQPYHFVSKQQFEKLIKEKKLLEWAKVYDHYYGNTKEEVESVLKKNRAVVLKIDPQGARTIKRLMPEAKIIFIVPPSFDKLAKRLVSRKTDSKAVIKKRLAAAKEEMKNLKAWDFVVVNEEGKLKQAALKVKNIIEGSLKKGKGKKKKLFGLLTGMTIVGYLLLALNLHPPAKKRVQDYYQRIIISFTINKRVHDSQFILNFLPRSFNQAYLIKPIKMEQVGFLDSTTFLYQKNDWPVLPEALIFYQNNSSENSLNEMGVIFKLASPVEDNWKKLEKAIKHFWAFKFPAQKPKALPDGTEVMELVVQEEKVIPENLNYQGTEIKTLIAQNSSLAFARINDYVVLAKSSKLVALILLTEKTSNQRANLKVSRRCLGQEPYYLILFADHKNPNKPLLLNNAIFSVIFGQDKPNNYHCL